MKKRKLLFQIFIVFTFPVMVIAQLRPSLKPQTQPFDLSTVRLCFTPYFQFGFGKIYKPEFTGYPVLPRLKQNGDLEIVSPVTQVQTSHHLFTWSPGVVLTVGIYNENQYGNIMISKLKQYAKEWENIANIKFSFVSDVNTAIIRVGLKRGEGDWSVLGRTAEGNQYSQPTMNFGRLDEGVPDAEFRAIVLHEFGHALGFAHENKPPFNVIKWDYEKLYAFLNSPPHNYGQDIGVIVDHTSRYTTNVGYDQYSIMRFFYPAYFTTDGSSAQQNNYFSPADIKLAGAVYPFPPKPTTAKGTLQTGDDCDEIDFLLEYNVVDPNFVDFVLQPGIDPWGVKVSWWKQIGVPMKGGTEATLQLQQDGRPDVKRLPFNILDNTRSLSFAKAKTLGVHTPLGYKWNALPAIKGGCRLTLTWKRDRCNKTF